MPPTDEETCMKWCYGYLQGHTGGSLHPGGFPSLHLCPSGMSHKEAIGLQLCMSSGGLCIVENYL